MQENAIFYLVFAVQLLLLSYYIPRLVMGRVERTLRDHPPETYPKMYPLPRENYEQGNRRYRSMNLVILALGIALLTAIGIWDRNSEGPVLETIPVIFFLVQMLPMILLEVSEWSYYRQMRQADRKTKRSAVLRPRKLTDIVSSRLLVAAAVLIAASIGVDLYVNQHIPDFALGMGKGTFLRTVNMLVVNALFAFIIGWNIYGKRLDPHINENDRVRQMQLTVRSMVIMSIVFSVFMIIREGTDDLGVDQYQPVLMSIYVQVIAYFSIVSRLNSLNKDPIDYDVYKEDAPATTQGC
ncbi:MAG: hypothetical protein AAF351_15055 [Pseudomonadota bacterium]